MYYGSENVVMYEIDTASRIHVIHNFPLLM